MPNFDDDIKHLDEHMTVQTLKNNKVCLFLDIVQSMKVFRVLFNSRRNIIVFTYNVINPWFFEYEI